MHNNSSQGNVPQLCRPLQYVAVPPAPKDKIFGTHDRLVRKAHVEGCAEGAAEGHGFGGVRDGDVVAGKVTRRVDASGSRWCGQAVGAGTDGTEAMEVRKGLRGGRDTMRRRAKER